MQRTGFRFRTKSPKNKTQEDLKKSSLDMDQNISFHESDRRRRCSGSSVVQLLFELATCFALSLGNCITLVTLRFPPCLDTCNRLCNFAWKIAHRSGCYPFQQFLELVTCLQLFMHMKTPKSKVWLHDVAALSSHFLTL